MEIKFDSIHGIPSLKKNIKNIFNSKNNLESNIKIHYLDYRKKVVCLDGYLNFECPHCYYNKDNLKTNTIYFNLENLTWDFKKVSNTKTIKVSEKHALIVAHFFNGIYNSLDFNSYNYLNFYPVHKIPKLSYVIESLEVEYRELIRKYSTALI